MVTKVSVQLTVYRTGLVRRKTVETQKIIQTSVPIETSVVSVWGDCYSAVCARTDGLTDLTHGKCRRASTDKPRRCSQVEKHWLDACTRPNVNHRRTFSWFSPVKINSVGVQCLQKRKFAVRTRYYYIIVIVAVGWGSCYSKIAQSRRRLLFRGVCGSSRLSQKESKREFHTLKIIATNPKIIIIIQIIIINYKLRQLQVIINRFTSCALRFKTAVVLFSYRKRQTRHDL